MDSGWGRLERRIARELDEYAQALEAHVQPIPRAQERRGLALALLASTLPEAFSPDLRDHAIELARDILRRDDYATYGWYAGASILTTAFALTSDRCFADPIVANIDHHSSELRDLMDETVAFIASSLAFDDLEPRVASSLEHHHLGAEMAVYLLMMSRDSEDRKRSWAMTQLDRRHNEPVVEILERVANDQLIVNPFLPLLMDVVAATAGLVLSALAPVSEEHDGPYQTQLALGSGSPDRPQLAEAGTWFFERLARLPALRPAVTLSELSPVEAGNHG
ncbi:MAG: hypothetical protein KC495_13840 [Dehalococcoidia bacterium]|nr:hypothetical protein [Dehalococcoidia bacterium]